MSELVTTCPFCAEPIEQGLSVCPWCDSRLGDEPPGDSGPDSLQEMPASAEPVEVRPVEGPSLPDDATAGMKVEVKDPEGPPPPDDAPSPDSAPRSAADAPPRSPVDLDGLDDDLSPVRRTAVEDPVAIRFCDQCGASLPARARFCGLCGAPAGP
jgi:hypothetical protein